MLGGVCFLLWVWWGGDEVGVERVEQRVMGGFFFGLCEGWCFFGVGCQGRNCEFARDLVLGEEGRGTDRGESVGGRGNAKGPEEREKAVFTERKRIFH